jgi:hypothetical protein
MYRERHGEITSNVYYFKSMTRELFLTDFNIDKVIEFNLAIFV